MGEHNVIYDLSGKIVGQFRFGVAWSRDPRTRLGEYDDVDNIEEIGYVYDNEENVVAKYGDGVVMNIIGEQIGCFENQKLIVDDKVVGRCIGSCGASAAAIALIFNWKGTRGDS